MKNQSIRRHSPSRDTGKNQSVSNRLIKSLPLSLLITFSIGIILLLGATAAAFLTSDPTSLVDPIGYVTLFATSFLGGFVASKISKRDPYLLSLLTGAGFVVLSMLFSFALPHSLSSGMELWVRLLLHLASFSTFPIGALAGIKASVSPRRKSRKKR